MKLSALTDQSPSLTRMMVCGSSMKPFFRAGETVAVQEVSFASIKKGSVVLFSHYDGAPRVMHRVVDIVYENGVRRFLCQGDNRSRPDGYIDEKQVVGKVVGRYPDRRFKPVRRRHEYGGLIFSRCYRRIKSTAKKTVMLAWPFLSRWSRKVTVCDHDGHERELVFMGWRNLKFNHNFSRLAVRAGDRG